MAQAPVILLAFANDRDAHLELLKEESRELFRTFREMDRKGIVSLHREESAQTRDMYEALVSNRDKVAIFHYAGHAGGTALQLEDGGGDAKGLVGILGEQANLKLVFLNGCSSRGQVAGLLDAGVAAVIATSSPIEDRKALEFSTAFYEALASRRTVQQAFQLAADFMQARYGQAISTETILRSSFSPEMLEESDEFPWGLYVNEDAETALRYQLPYLRPISLPKEVMQYIGQSFTANRYILMVLDEMCQYNPDIYAQMVEQRGEELIKKDSKDYPELIIRNFPWPIGSQIRLLRLKANPNRERLEILLSTYIVTSQVLYYILLSDLWGQQHAGRFQMGKDRPTLSSQAAYVPFDFLSALCKLYEQAQAQQVMLFVPEFELFHAAFTAEGSHLSKAWHYLEQMRETLAGAEIPDLETTCLRAEQAVAVILKHAAFLARFRMMTVRNVMIDNPRFTPLAYELHMGPLNASEDVNLRLYQDDIHRRKDSYANSQSVVLVADEERMHQSLNLSPFIMDKNTFVQVKKSNTTEADNKDVAHIFLLGWEEGEKLIYLTVNHSLFVALNNEKGTDQVHTDMRQEDFTEGRNLGEVDDFDLDFGFGFEESQASESPRVFTLLKDQYDLFKSGVHLG